MPAETKKPARKAAPSKGAAAVAETNGNGHRTVTWHDLELRIPGQLPVMGVTAAFRRLQKAADGEDGQAVMGYLTDMVDLLLDRNETHADLVWEEIDTNGLDAFQAVFELLDTVAAEYGTSTGESTASR